MATTLSPSNLKTVNAYNDLTWAATYNDNLTLLNNTLLKLSELMDVSKTGLAHGQILAYSEAAEKWIPITPTSNIKAVGRPPKFL